MKLVLITFLERRMKGDQIETCKIMEFLIMIDIFWVYIFELEIYYQGRFQKLSLLTNWIFLAKRVISFWKKLPYQIKNSIRVKSTKIKLNDFRNNGKKKNLRRPTREPNRIWSVNRYCIISVYVLCNDSFFLRLIWEDSTRGIPKEA